MVQMSFPTGDALTQQPSSKGKAEGENAAVTQSPQRWSASKTLNRQNPVVQGTTEGVKVIL